MTPARAWWGTTAKPAIRETAGPVRVVTDETNDVVKHPLGFAPPERPVKRRFEWRLLSVRVEQVPPLLWEGDQA